MTRIPKTILLAALACTALSGCGPHLKKLGVCSGGKYRYANPHGVSLPSLDVPTVDEVNGAAAPVPTPRQPLPGTATPPPSSNPDAAKGSLPPQASPSPAPSPAPSPDDPVAAPPKHGAMLLPAPGSTSFGSC